MWLRIHAGIKLIQVSKRSPSRSNAVLWSCGLPIWRNCTYHIAYLFHWLTIWSVTYYWPCPSFQSMGWWVNSDNPWLMMVLGLFDSKPLFSVIIKCFVCHITSDWLSWKIAMTLLANKFNDGVHVRSIKKLPWSYYHRTVDFWCTIKCC